MLTGHHHARRPETMTTTTSTPPELAAELRELAAWLDDLAAALDDRKGGAYTPAELRRWMSQQAARCHARAFLTRQAIGENPGQATAEAAPLAATADHIAGSCEFCPVGGGGCPVCRPKS